MSWSITLHGRPRAVAKEFRKQADAINCQSPEQEIKQQTAAMVECALDAYPDDTSVKVQASGSQYNPSGRTGDKFINNLSVTIEPLFGFVEDLGDPDPGVDAAQDQKTE